MADHSPPPTTAIIERPHSRISPSSFERAEKCSQSVRLSAYAPPRLAGPEAQAGTAAHHLLEICLKRGLDTFEIDLATLKVDGHEVTIDDEMLDAVQFVLNWIRNNMRPPLLVEKRVSLKFADPYLGSPMFGWIDVATEHGPPWIVADAKFGYNVVEASSVQMGLYLLGLALEHEPTLTRNGPAGTTVVIQPNARAVPVRTFEYTFKDLRELRDRVIAALIRIKRQEWSFKFGDWCRYCVAAGICPHLHAIARDPALTAVSPSPEAVALGEISKEQLEDALDRAAILEHFLKQLYATAEDYLIQGGKLRNRKLVRKRTNRRWIDEAKAVEWLEAVGVDPYEPRKVVSPAQAEKIVPKARKPEIDKTLAEQPVGELTSAPMSDPKPAIEVGATLRRSLEQSVAGGFLEASSKTSCVPET